MRNKLGIIGTLFLYCRAGVNRALRLALKPLFLKCGRNVSFDPFGKYSFATISIGNDVYIGPGANFSASNSTLEIGNKVLFGPNVTIMTGDHNTGVEGRFMFDVHEKRPEDDQPVLIEDDVWIGACVTILKGVRIHRGAIVAAGALVTQNMPPYAIVGGLPARVIHFRWTVEQIQRHEEILYPQELRLPEHYLKSVVNGVE